MRPRTRHLFVSLLAATAVAGLAAPAHAAGADPSSSAGRPIVLSAPSATGPTLHIDCMQEHWHYAVAVAFSLTWDGRVVRPSQGPVELWALTRDDGWQPMQVTWTGPGMVQTSLWGALHDHGGATHLRVKVAGAVSQAAPWDLSPNCAA